MINLIKVYGLIALSMILWSVSFIWTKVAIISFQPNTLIMLRLVIATLLLFSFSIVTGKFQKIRKEDLKWFLILAFFEPYLYFLGETHGLTLIKSTFASVIVSTIPLFAPILAFVVLRERISWANVLGIIISLIGVYFVIYEGSTTIKSNPWGVTLMFIAVFAGICYTIILKKIPLHYSSISIVFYQNLFGLTFFIPTVLITDSTNLQHIEFTTESVTALILLAVFASVIAFIFFASSIRKLGVTKANAFVNLIPVFTAIFSWIILDEILPNHKWIGIAIVVFGLFISQLKNRSIKSN